MFILIRLYPVRLSNTSCSLLITPNIHAFPQFCTTVLRLRSLNDAVQIGVLVGNHANPCHVNIVQRPRIAERGPRRLTTDGCRIVVLRVERRIQIDQVNTGIVKPPQDLQTIPREHRPMLDIGLVVRSPLASLLSCAAFISKRATTRVRPYNPFVSFVSFVDFSSHLLYQMRHNIISTIRRILAHVKIEGRWNLGERAYPNFDQAHILSDKLSKLTGGNLSQPLEARNLGISQSATA